MQLRMPKQTELFLLDVSHSLLNAAYRHCCETLPDIRTYTIHGSFLDLPKLPMMVNPLRGRTRLFAMLGYTLVNLSDELRFFRDTLSCCEPGELFLFDLQIALCSRPVSDRRSSKLDPDRQRQAATLTRCQMAERADSSLLPRCRRHRAALGAGPTRRRARQLRLRRHRPSQDARRQTRSPLPHVQRVRRYDPKLLSDSLAELGWKTIERIDYGPDGKKSMALLLLQKQ
jgi:hypothetical protein